VARLELRHVRARDGRTETVYAVRADTLRIGALHGSTVLLEETLVTPASGWPKFEGRAALLKL